MPKYLNGSTRRIVIDGAPIGPGESVETLEFLDLTNTDAYPAGVTKVTDAPMYNPIILSQEVIGDTTIAIPLTDDLGNKVTRYTIHFYVETGEPVITFSSASNLPALKLYTGAKWNVRSYGRIINDIRIAVTGIVWVIVEKT